MYDGDKNRDASDKIRGFLFQDYIAIKCLLEDNVKYVCSEFLEDIDVFFQDGRFVFIQAKYYPNTPPKKGEIFTDLYYQYLRLQMLNSTLDAAPNLYIHRVSNVELPTMDEMKKYVGVVLPDKVVYPNEQDAKTFLKAEIYTLTTKEEQKKKLFMKLASEESLNSFLEKCSIIQLSNIVEYRAEVVNALAKSYPSIDPSIDQGKRQLILLGLAISYIQRRYTLNNPSFDQLKVDKNDFDRYMLQTVNTRKEISIVYYLVALVSEKYSSILTHNDLSDLQAYMLNLIYQNTVQWIKEIGDTEEGQYRLYYTISYDEISEIIKYKNESIENKLRKMAECKPTFCAFLGYLWKIMLDICQEEIGDFTQITNKADLLNPSCYIVDSVSDYVCFRFPEDKEVKHTVILPPVGRDLSGGKRRIAERMIGIVPKPGKWFMENSKMIWGKNYYDYSTANVCENPSVVDLGEDTFYVECMECIGIGEGEWNVVDSCSHCIFTEKCVNEGKRK